MPYSAKAIANAFLQIGRNEKKPITQMKLQKLVYIAHGWNLALFNEPLIDDSIEAWQHGPVIPNLYNEFKGFRGNPITEDATEVEIDFDTFDIVYTPITLPDEDEVVHKLIRKIWDKYGHLSGPQLSDLTHRTGTPWSKIFKAGHQHLQIPTDVIQQHYNDLLGRKVS